MWLITIYNRVLQTLPSHFFTSLLLGAAPIGLLALVIVLVSGGLELTAGHWLMFFWLSFAPFAVCKADNALDRLVQDSRQNQPANVQAALSKAQRRLRSPKQWFFSLPWALTIASLGTLPLKGSMFDAVGVWAFLMLFYTFLISGIGFNGIFSVLRLFQDLKKNVPEIDPFAADKLGGLKRFSQLSILATLLFSTGALAFPLAYEIAQTVRAESFLQYLVGGLAAIYVVCILAVFLGPMLALQEIISFRKEEHIADSNRFMEKCFQESTHAADTEGTLILDRLRTHFDVFHSRLEGVKDYPYDFRILFELLVSLAIPILVAVFQHHILSV